MNMKKKVAFVIATVVLAVPTGYFALQLWDIVALLSIIVVWAIPFEIFAIAIIIKGRKAKEGPLLHNRMLAIVYGLQGLGFIAAPLSLFWGAIINFLIPPLPSPDFYYSSFAASFAVFLILTLAFSISAVFFVITYGFIRNRSWAKKVAFPVSFLSVLVWSYVEFHLVRAWFFEGLATMFFLSLILLILALAVANAIAVYVLVWRYVASRQARIQRKPNPSSLVPQQEVCAPVGLNLEKDGQATIQA